MPTDSRGYSPEEAVARHEAEKKARLERLHAGRPKFTQEVLKAKRLAALNEAMLVRKEKIRQRETIREKVRMGLPITEEEAQWLNFRGSVKDTDKNAQEKAALDAVATLVVDQSDVKTLRAMVDRVAKRHSYNPLEQLIKMTLPQEDGTYLLPAADRATIHKSLLPYLTPQLKVSPIKEPDPEIQGTKVSIKQFVFPEEAAEGKKIYEAKQVRVSTSDAEPLK